MSPSLSLASSTGVQGSKGILRRVARPRIQVRYLCDGIDTLRARLRDIEGDIENMLRAHEVGSLLTTIDGIGPQTAASALASFVGVVPATSHSGKHRPERAGISPLGHAALRRSLWMPTLRAVRINPWLRAHYLRLRAKGKLPKVALVACMRKLLTAVYSVAKNRRPFTPLLPPAPLPPHA